MSTEERTKQLISTRDLVFIAISAALIAICSWISIPAAVPFTLQTFAVFLILCLLGAKRASLAIAVYIMLGAAGLPVFSGFGGGIGYLLGTTGGYILGFLLMGPIYALFVRSGRAALSQRTSRPGSAALSQRTFLSGSATLWRQALALLLGLIACYATGTFWFMVVYARGHGSVSFGTVLSWCVLPFIIPDLIKLALALFLSRRISPALRLTGR